MVRQSKPKLSFPSIIETVWWVGFTDNPSPKRWWQRFTCRGFRHVYLYARAAGDCVVVMCMSPGGLSVNHLSLADVTTSGRSSVHEYLNEIFNPTVVIPVIGMIAQQTPISRLAPFTCVELARSILGIDRQIYTPKGLYRYLVSNRLSRDLLKDYLAC